MSIRTLINPNTEEILDGPLPDRAPLRFHRRLPGYEETPLVDAPKLAGALGVDHHAPLKTSAKLQKVHSKIRTLSPPLAQDRYWADEMSALQSAVLAGEFGTFDAA